ncbi:MAG: DUF3307 domain-containing protein [Promethearchaeota archaeon]
MLPDVKELVAALIAAHFLADFVFQSKKTVENKSNIFVLLKHALLVSVTSYVLCGTWEIWILPLAILLGHAILDFIKSRIKTRFLTVFIIDQVAHIAFLIALSIWMTEQYSPTLYWVILFGDIWTKLLIILAGAIAAIQAGSVLIGIAVQPLLKDISQENGEEISQRARLSGGLKKGGKLIGQLERAIIFLLVLAGHPEGVGFLIAAKSIFRFGEIKDIKQRKEAEYIIIGTFMSFGYGLLIAFLTKYFMF